MLSIITPVFNSVDLIGQTLDSIRQQKQLVDIEYIVIDGGSTDGTLEILESVDFIDI